MMKKLPRTHSCFVCGTSNRHGLNLDFETDGQIVRAKFIPHPDHVGFKGVTHGGILATILDEIMVWACGVKTRQFAFCAELNVRYLQQVTPGMELWAEGELVVNRKNRIFEARSSIRDTTGCMLASATGKYMPIKEEKCQSFLEEFESRPSTQAELFE
jgi:uncharacterized protein (TIGR00369 family)